jgi:hypothetical protein
MIIFAKVDFLSLFGDNLSDANVISFHRPRTFHVRELHVYLFSFIRVRPRDWTRPEEHDVGPTFHANAHKTVAILRLLQRNPVQHISPQCVGASIHNTSIVSTYSWEHWTNEPHRARSASWRILSTPRSVGTLPHNILSPSNNKQHHQTFIFFSIPWDPFVLTKFKIMTTVSTQVMNMGVLEHLQRQTINNATISVDTLKL